VLKVEAEGKNKAKITLLVTYEVTPEQQENKDAEGEDKKPPAPSKKTSTKAIVVPVEHNGSTYGVYELPTFTTTKQQTNLKYDTSEERESYPNTFVVQKIHNFLNTFFKSYSEDGKDQLSYLLEDKQHQDGLQNSLKFVEVENVDVLKGDKKNEYIVDCLVSFEDPDSKTHMQTRYRLTVEKKDSRYIVSKIN